MPTKLSRYCEGIMEAAWLAAVIVVPIFFNIYSSRIFEPDKLTLLRSLALVILGAWIIKLIDQGKNEWSNLNVEGESWLQTILRVPFLPQVLLLTAVYILANVFSVTPRVSFWGSYQRLQGTYTTLGYLIVFAAIVGNLRRQPQVERIITAVVLSSLPVALYGVLQRYQIDPVPWGGNVSNRIAANMGNSIFVAAYLIMTFPLAAGRIVNSFSAILREETEELASHVARGTVYVFVASIQLIAIYMSGSRGPMLGLLAGSFFLFLVLSLYWGKRWMTVGVVGLAGLAGVFLVLLNIPNGPLESIRNEPWVGRFSRLMDTDQRTSQVRILIWQGASELVTPHEPIEYPDGEQDALNFLRPLIGYGPESMYVAYNPFYPPELGDLESRNASPDRSHNETWDSLVITGFLGLIAYLALFTSVFYYGLKWLGLINSTRQRNLFLLLFLGGGAVSAVGFIYWGGIEFFGVGLPFGMMIGLVAYLPVIALFGHYEPPQTEGGKLRSLILMMVLGAIVAHFVEIHFGIAIAATRTHFWVYTALLLVVGHVMTLKGVYGGRAEEVFRQETAVEPIFEEVNKGDRKKRRRGRRRGRSRDEPSAIWKHHALVGGAVASIIVMTLGFNFVTNSARAISPLRIIWDSMTKLPNLDYALSYGVLAMVLTTWIAAGVAFSAESAKSEKSFPLSATLVTLVVAGGIGWLFWLFHASSLASLVNFTPPPGTENVIIAQSAALESLLTKYYIYLFLLILVLAWILPREWPTRFSSYNSFAPIATPFVLVIVVWLISITNLRVIHADIAFKMAEPFTRGGDNAQWQIAIDLYQRAKRLAPSEDHYYLFLGRGYLELARTLEERAERERLMERARMDLTQAQRINPLNTDHTANLARLYRFWASLDPDQRGARARRSSEYYSRAVVLSPQNSIIWNEWALLNLSVLNDSEEALDIISQTLEIDPYYDGTYALLADYYLQQARQETDPDAKSDVLQRAAINYRKAISNTQRKRGVAEVLYTYYVALGGVYTEMADFEKAIDTYLIALDLAKKGQIWRVEDTLARLYVQVGELENAMIYASSALTNAPDGQKERVQQLVDFLQQNP